MKNRYKPSLYATLNLPDNSKIPEVKKSYRKLVFLYHPDTGKEPDSTKFIVLTEVYNELSDPIKKATYDLRLKTFKNIEEEKRKEKKRASNSYQDSTSNSWKDIYENRDNSRIDMDDLIIGGVGIIFSAIVLNKVLKRSK